MSIDVEPEQPSRSPSGFLVREFAHPEIRRGAQGGRPDPDGEGAQQRQSPGRDSAIDFRTSAESPEAENSSKHHGGTLLAKLAASRQPIAALDDDRKAAAAPGSCGRTGLRHGGDAEPALLAAVDSISQALHLFQHIVGNSNGACTSGTSGVRDGSPPRLKCDQANDAYVSGASNPSAFASSTRPQGLWSSEVWSSSGVEATAQRRGVSGDEAWRTELKALSRRMGILMQSQMRIEKVVCGQKEAPDKKIAALPPTLASRFVSVGPVGLASRTASLALSPQAVAQAGKARAKTDGRSNPREGSRSRSKESTSGPNREAESPGFMTPNSSTQDCCDDTKEVADVLNAKAGGRDSKHRRGSKSGGVSDKVTSSGAWPKSPRTRAVSKDSNGTPRVASGLRPLGQASSFDLTQFVHEVNLKDQSSLHVDNGEHPVVIIQEECDREHAADQASDKTTGAAPVGSMESFKVCHRGSEGKLVRHMSRRASGASGRFRVDLQELERMSRPRMRPSFGGEAVGHIVERAAQRWSTVVDCLRNIAMNPKYEYLLAVTILSSVVFVGIETQTMAEGSTEKDDLFQVANATFDIVFAIDVLFKVFVHGRKYFTNADWRWNILDANFVFACIIADLITLFVDIDIAGRALRAIRLVRLVRTIRVARAIRSIREFQKMAYALMSSARTLVCSLLILFFVLYFFGILFCQAVADFKASESATPQLEESLDLWYGSLVVSFTTLFMAVTGGVSWQLAYDPLRALNGVYSAVFMFYMAIVLFGVMNVVTSVFVESAVMSAQHYKDLIIQEKENEREIAMSHMKQVFRQIDEDGSGFVTGEEMEAFLQDPNLRQYVNALDINAEDARMLFRLLDKDGSQRVDIDEFCEGCIRLQGDAKSFDVHTMIFQMGLFLGKWGDFTMFVEERFGRLDVILGLEDEEEDAGPVSDTGSKRDSRNSFAAPLVARMSGCKSLISSD